MFDSCNCESPLLISFCALLGVVLLYVNFHLVVSLFSNSVANDYTLCPGLGTVNNDIKIWRNSIQNVCVNAKSSDDVKAIDIVNFSRIYDHSNYKHVGRKNTDLEKIAIRNDTALIRCSRVILDLSPNDGKTLNYFVDSGLVGCDRRPDLGPDALTKTLHFNISHLEIEGSKFQFVEEINPLTKLLKQIIFSKNTPLDELEHYGPEDYCYYGLEGNPIHTKWLKSLEEMSLSWKPRPVKYVHFLTESVPSTTDGPVTFYFDPLHEEKNMWSNTFYPEYLYQAKSINSTLTRKTVKGYNIGRLLEKIMSSLNQKHPCYFSNIKNKECKKNHLIIHIDFPGAHFLLYDESLPEGPLCHFIKEMGHEVDAIIPSFFTYNDVSVSYPNNRIIRERVAYCGITLHMT